MRMYVDNAAIDGLVDKLNRLGAGASQAAVEMAQAAGEYIVEELQNAVDLNHYREGGLEKSVALKGKPQVTDTGATVTVTFKGTAPSGARYGEIAAYLNYGTGKKGNGGGIAPSHFVDNTREDVRGPAAEIAQEVLDRLIAGK